MLFNLFNIMSRRFLRDWFDGFAAFIAALEWGFGQVWGLIVNGLHVG
jgi:hypothetical protein